MYFWQINDGRIWSSEQARFVDPSEAPQPPAPVEPPEGEDPQPDFGDIGDPSGQVIPLYSDGKPAGVEYLRKTIVFYGFDLGELKNRLEKIQAIQAGYTPQLKLLQDAKAGAELRDDDDEIGEIKDEYTALLNEMNAKIQAVPAD